MFPPKSYRDSQTLVCRTWGLKVLPQGLPVAGTIGHDTTHWRVQLFLRLTLHKTISPAPQGVTASLKDGTDEHYTGIATTAHAAQYMCLLTCSQPQGSWGFIHPGDVHQFLILGRPFKPWPELKELREVVMAISIVVGAEPAPTGAALCGPVGTEVVVFDDSGRLPLRSGSADCLLLLVHDSVLRRRDLPFLSRVLPVLSAQGVVFMMLASGSSTRADVATLCRLEQALEPFALSIHTLRQVTPLLERFCGERVLDASRQVLLPGAALTSGRSFTVLQIQRQNTSTAQAVQSPDTLRERIQNLVEESLAVDPLVQGLHDEQEDVEFFRPLPPESCFPHLANYYDWKQVYPELKLLIDNFDVIKKEAFAVSGWTPWPEYHFREGGQSDWRVYPFLHTFPATDVSKSQWVPATCARCPETVRVLKQLPRLRTALFSRLGPATKLSAHTGWEDLANHVLRCHLTIKTPPRPPESWPSSRSSSSSSSSLKGWCGTWVEGEVRYHQEEDIIVFDDSKIHKAFNLHPTESRIVLIVDMLRPDGIPMGVAEGGHTPELDDFISAFR